METLLASRLVAELPTARENIRFRVVSDHLRGVGAFTGVVRARPVIDILAELHFPCFANRPNFGKDTCVKILRGMIQAKAKELCERDLE